MSPIAADWNVKKTDTSLGKQSSGKPNAAKRRLAAFDDHGDAFLRVGAGRDARQGQRLVCELHLGQPDDLPGAILFFASDDAAYITGQVLSVSGGLTMAGR